MTDGKTITCADLIQRSVIRHHRVWQRNGETANLKENKAILLTVDCV